MKACTISNTARKIGRTDFLSKEKYLCEPKTCYRVWTIYMFSWNCELPTRSWCIGEIEGRYCDSIEWLKKNEIWIDEIPHPSGYCTYIQSDVKTIRNFQISLPNPAKKD